MKKLVLLIAVVFALCAVVVFAGALDATLDGNDVLVPDRVVKAIPGYDSSKSVYAANDANGWFIRGPERVPAEVLSASEIKKEGDYWRAKEMKGKRFQIIQLKDNSYTKKSPSWAKLESFIPVGWISEEDPGICILVK